MSASKERLVDMAILQPDEHDIKVEIEFQSYKYGGPHYHFRFLYGERPLFNPELFEKEWVEVDEYEEDTLIPFLERAMEVDATAYWEPTDPDVILEIESSRSPVGYDRVWGVGMWWRSWEEHEKAKAEWAKKVAESDQSDNDYFDLTFIVEEDRMKKFEGMKYRGYGATGPAVRMFASRKELQAFVDDLRREYRQFVQEHFDEMCSVMGHKPAIP